MRVRGVPGRDTLGRLRAGIELEDGRTAPAKVTRPREVRWGAAPAGHAWLRIVLHEGRKRQIRRMCEAVGHPVRRLIRVRIGPIELGDLAAGAYCPLTRAEKRSLREAIAD